MSLYTAETPAYAAVIAAATAAQPTLEGYALMEAHAGRLSYPVLSLIDAVKALRAQEGV